MFNHRPAFNLCQVNCVVLGNQHRLRQALQIIPEIESTQAVFDTIGSSNHTQRTGRKRDFLNIPNRFFAYRQRSTRKLDDMRTFWILKISSPL